MLLLMWTVPEIKIKHPTKSTGITCYMYIFHGFFLTDIAVLAKFVIKTPPQIFLTLWRTSVNGAEISYLFFPWEFQHI